MNEAEERKAYEDWLHQSPEFADTIISAWDVWLGRAALAQPEPAAPEDIPACMFCGELIEPAAPRAALTDEEIRDLWSWSANHEAERTATTQQHAFARAIEAAHGIGGPRNE